MSLSSTTALYREICDHHFQLTYMVIGHTCHSACRGCHLRLQEVHEVNDPGHQEHVVVGMECVHDLIHSIVWFEDWK